MNTRPRAALLLALLVGCGAPRWSEPITSFGSMREVMRDGRTEGRVALTDVLGSDSTVGLGALAGLRGEIAIVDGVAWVARVGPSGVECAEGALADDRATLLAICDVHAWRSIELRADVAPEQLEAFLARIAEQHGFSPDTPWPFVIEGELAAVEAHVLNGACPFAGPVAPEREPFRRAFAAPRGRLVGFYAPAAAGTLVHHGQAAHVHAIVTDPELYVGHVDRAGARAGAVLRIPRS